MIRFNIIGTGFVDLQEKGLSFKAENHQFRFSEISLGRSVEFSIPATAANRQKMGFGDDPARVGEMLRKSLPCQMVYDGGVVDGTLNVTGFEGEAFKCVFLTENAPWIDDLQGKELADCVCTFDPVVWSTATPVVTADNADPSAGVQLLLYDNGLGIQPQQWQLVPSVNVRAFCDDILTQLGVRHTLQVPRDLWMVAGSMNGGGSDTVTFGGTADNALSLTQTLDYFQVGWSTYEWATGFIFGVLTGGGDFSAQIFIANQDVKVTFPADMPSGLFLVKHDPKLMDCVTLAGEYTNGFSGNPGHQCQKLQGATVSLKKYDRVFFSKWPAPDIAMQASVSPWGWQPGSIIDYPYSFSALVEADGDISLGDKWLVQSNMPDCTVFEFLKSVALATGLDLNVTATEGVTMREPYYGNPFKALAKVVSVDSVTRRVDAWGASTGRAQVVFDSEDYVESPIVSGYQIGNALLADTKDFKAIFSEGGQSDNGVLILDVDSASVPPKFKAKRWTLAVAGSGTYLQRIEAPSVAAYGDIAANSTCVKVKVLAGEAEFFRLTFGDVLLWRGIAYVWTDAQWSGGVMSLTLQKVSQPTATESE